MGFSVANSLGSQIFPRNCHHRNVNYLFSSKKERYSIHLERSKLKHLPKIVLSSKLELIDIEERTSPIEVYIFHFITQVSIFSLMIRSKKFVF